MILARKTCVLFFGSLLLTMAVLFQGCANYQPGSASQLPFESIYIAPATNDSFAPQAQALVSSQIREAFIRDGRVKVVTSEENADAILLVNLTDYDRKSAARQSTDTVIARDFDIRLYAEASLYNAKAGDYYFKNRKLNDRSSVYVDNPYADSEIDQMQDYNHAEYNAMTRLARDLGRKIADEVLSVW
ncbi:LPS assembly lipoprotein LptE [Coraliomargarita parva]|uniref:LPS assembly lipoprotein LptE n=1 Tax=Coraliomargarita parva TaxID=3014050 RepID=UPI0022B44458|nr:LPS assembly lipoprotein LptE [Coraliomargarita parva]